MAATEEDILSFVRSSIRSAWTLEVLLLAAAQTLLPALDLPREEQGWVYLLRLAAFALIVIAIAQKNMAHRSD